MKKLISLILLTALAASVFAGCGGSANSSGTPADGGGDGSSSAEPASAGEAVLTFPCIWVGSDSKAEVFGQMVAGFNEENAGKYQVKIEDQTDYDAYRDKIRTLISTGAAPDIFTVQDFPDLELYASSGKLMDLTSFLSDSDMSGRFVEGLVESSKIDGANYAMPYENAVIPIMYNNKLLEQAGVTSVPTTYDELWDACEKLKAQGVFPTTQMTSANAWTSMLWYSYALAACGGPDVYKNGFDDPAFEKAAEIMVKMFEYSSSDAVGADATVVNGHFFNERAAIYTNGSWILGRIKTEGVEGLYDNLVLSPGLSYEGKNGGAYVNAVQAYLVAGKQDDPVKEEAVKAFLQYVSDPERVAELANSSGALFAIDLDASNITDPLQSLIVQQSSEAAFMIGYFQGSVPTAVANAFPAALESLIIGDITPAEFVQQLKDVQSANS